MKMYICETVVTADLNNFTTMENGDSSAMKWELRDRKLEVLHSQMLIHPQSNGCIHYLSY